MVACRQLTTFGYEGGPPVVPRSLPWPPKTTSAHSAGCPTHRSLPSPREACRWREPRTGPVRRPEAWCRPGRRVPSTDRLTTRAFPSSGCHSLALNSVSTSSTTPFEPSSATSMETLDGALETRRAGRSLRRCWQTSPTCAGQRGARFVVIALAAYLLWSGPHLIFHAAHQHADSALCVAYGSGTGAVDPRGPESGGDDVTTVTVELSPWGSQVHCPGEVVGPAGIGSRWHDTPTSKPPASQPNSTSAETVTRGR
jgi:hypothetical protein